MSVPPSIDRVVSPYSASYSGDRRDQRDRRLGQARDRKRRIGLQLLQRPARDDATGLDQHEMVGEALDLGEVVADVQDRDRERGVQRLEIGQDLVLAQAVEPGQRLVHQQQPGLREQRAADRDPLALAAREAQRRPIEQTLHPEQRHDVVEPDRLLGPPCRTARRWP